MSAELTVVFKDEGNNLPIPPASSTTPQPGLADAYDMPAGPRRREPTAGPPAGQKKEPLDKPKKEPTFLEDLGAAGKIAGMGGLVGEVTLLGRAFQRIYTALTGGAGGSSDVGGSRTPPIRLPGVAGAWPIVPPRGPVAASPVAGPPVGASAAASGGTIASLSAAAGPAAIAIAAVTVAAIGLGIAAKKVADGLHAEAERLSLYSPELAVATSMSNLRSEFADMRRAQRVGPQLARFEENRGELAAKLKDIHTALLEKALEVINKLDPLFDLGVDGLALLAKHLPQIVNILITLSPAAMAASLIATHSEAIEKLIRKLLRMKEDEEATDPLNDPFTDAFVASFGLPALPRIVRGGVPAGGAAGP